MRMADGQKRNHSVNSPVSTARLTTFSQNASSPYSICLLYTSDAADEL